MCVCVCACRVCGPCLLFVGSGTAMGLCTYVTLIPPCSFPAAGIRSYVIIQLNQNDAPWDLFALRSAKKSVEPPADCGFGICCQFLPPPNLVVGLYVGSVGIGLRDCNCSWTHCHDSLFFLGFFSGLGVRGFAAFHSSAFVCGEYLFGLSNHGWVASRRGETLSANNEGGGRAQC